MKKALVLATVASTIEQFNMNNIQLLKEKGFNIDVIANFKEGSNISDEKISQFKNKLNLLGVRVIHVPLPRKISHLKKIMHSFKIVKSYCDNENYDLIHCHTPIGSVVARLAAIKSRKNGTRVIYTAHGFHFYKGAPLFNWLVFYPIEKICSIWTDVLITINFEDYNFAKKHMSAKKIKYIPGIGVDTSKFNLCNFEKDSKRVELNIPKDNMVLLSLGELNDNKNHEIVIKAISKMNRKNITYLIAGKGNKAEYLKELAKNLDVDLQLLGYRTDISELLNMSDIYVFPSFREGLSVALMEAMSAGLPCVVSKIRGNIDLIDEGKGGFLCNPSNELEFSKYIEILFDKKKQEVFGEYNKTKIKEFDEEKINELMKNIYFYN